MQTALIVKEKGWLRPSLSEGKSLYSGTAPVWLGCYGGFLTATTNAEEAVGEAGCGEAGGLPMRSCYHLGEGLCAGLYCEPQSHLG